MTPARAVVEFEERTTGQTRRGKVRVDRYGWIMGEAAEQTVARSALGIVARWPNVRSPRVVEVTIGDGATMKMDPPVMEREDG